LPAGEPKLKSTDIVRELSEQWKVMDPDTKVAVTDPLLDELETWRKEIENKPKITPIHVLNDVTATMTKINGEVCHICYILASW
jgi:predicted pyridoxine 5'-phosphate oxidase superfamily flavin-nucleotide-binding protein